MILLAAFVVVAVTSSVHGAVGFGMNLLAVPVLVILNPVLVPGPAVALGLLLSGLVAGREHTMPDRRLVWAVAGVLPGTLVALALLAEVPSKSLSAPIGALVLIAVGLSAVHLRIAPTRPALAVAGLASGFLATAGSIGGPPLALVYAHESGPRLRNNLSVFFVLTALMSLVALAVSGHFGIVELKASAALVPAVVVGFIASKYLRPLVDRGYTRPAVLVLSALAGAAAIAEGVLR